MIASHEHRAAHTQFRLDTLQVMWPVSEDRSITAALWQALMLELSSDALHAIEV